MKRNLAGLAGILAVVVVELHPVPVDACGVKLIIKPPPARRVLARSSKPSHLLLLGTPTHRLERELAAAGHDVEVASRLSDAKRSSYAVVVVTDARQQQEAQARFAGADVVVSSGEFSSDVALVEEQVARRPVAATETAARSSNTTKRTPVATGPARDDTDRKIVASGGPLPTMVTRDGDAPTTVEKANRGAHEARLTTDPGLTPTEPKLVPSLATMGPKNPESKSKPASAAKAPAFDDVYFTVGSAKVSRQNLALARAAKWLTSTADAHVVIEGYADPTGTPEANMSLSRDRAESVRDYMVSAGVDSSRIDVMAYGDTRVKYGRTDPRNRRVTIEPKH